jgi:hypothetical protein
MPMSFGKTKWLNENLQPLRRFLMSRRGKRWDDVYAELRRNLAPQSAIDMHIFQHLDHFVSFARRDRAGRVVLLDSFGNFDGELLADGTLVRERPPYRGLLYVCCDTGTLRWIRPSRRKRRRQLK